MLPPTIPRLNHIGIALTALIYTGGVNTKHLPLPYGCVCSSAFIVKRRSGAGLAPDISITAGQSTRSALPVSSRFITCRVTAICLLIALTALIYTGGVNTKQLPLPYGCVCSCLSVCSRCKTYVACCICARQKSGGSKSAIRPTSMKRRSGADLAPDISITTCELLRPID